MSSFKSLRENGDKYTFINPLIGTVSAPATDVGVFSELQEELQEYIEKEKKNKELYDVSFYFRDLSSPLWFGINENSSFFPASLFKLPIAIAVYRQGEKEPGFLGKVVRYTKELDEINKSIPENAESKLVVGETYSVENLVTIMLEHSDNGAKDLLLMALDRKYLVELFRIVSGVDPFTTATDEISSRKYAHFLRLLYSASYLNEENSEQILSILSQGEFKEGIIAGLPQAVKVANKFGIYEMNLPIKGELTNVTMLHDCGVVYHTGHPYILCVMTQGKDVQSLLQVISSVSKIVYTYQTRHDSGVEKEH